MYALFSDRKKWDWSYFKKEMEGKLWLRQRKAQNRL